MARFSVTSNGAGTVSCPTCHHRGFCWPTYLYTVQLHLLPAGLPCMRPTPPFATSMSTSTTSPL
ncbi:hypothetical protein FA95DRAFT_1555709, partial [Auriscalpium vulgare]